MRFLTWILALYPRAFRERFGAGMRGALVEDYARARVKGRIPAAVFAGATVLHALYFAIAERLPRVATVHAFLTVDLRDAIRSLWATPIVTIVSVASLALGIGANTALFSILNSLVMRPLPVHEPEQLVMVGRTDWTNPIWEEIRDRQADLFHSAGAWSFTRFNLADSGRTDPVAGAYCSGGLFQMLGVGTIVGRPLLPQDDVRSGGADGHVAVISYGLWQQRYGGVPEVVGRRLTIGGVPFTIVGVTRRGFLGPEVGQAMDVFVPLASEKAIRGRESSLDGRTSWWLEVMARLRPGQSADAAAAALNAVRPSIREATMPPEYGADYRASYLVDPIPLVPAATGVSPLRDRFEQPLTIIMLVVAAVLLIACANIANLMLARATARQHQMSVRLALGASRLRLACQLFAESLFVAAAGGVAGLAMASFGARLLISQLGSDVSTVNLDVPIDWRVLGFTASVALGATMLFGLAPAVGLGRISPHDALKDQNRRVSGDRRHVLRGALVVAQIALSFVLMAGAGLFVRTFASLATTPLGFDPSRLLIVGVDAGRRHASPLEHAAFAQQLADVAASAPGVSRASLSYLTPMSGRNWTNRVQVGDGPTRSRAEQTTTINAVSPGWFETYDMRLVAGRDVASTDTPGSVAVAVVNEAFVRRFVGSGSPLGLRIKALGLGAFKDRVIVGVVTDAVYRTVRMGIAPTVYLPMSQAELFGFGFAITVELNDGAAAVERTLTETLARTDPRLTFSFRDYSDQVNATLTQERLVATLSGFFGALATLLAALGLYGVTSYSVSRRKSEIAVRMALGANAAGVVRLVLRRVSVLLAIGSAIGVGLSLWAAKFVGALLFNVEARDPLTLAGAASVLITIGMLAGWLPARTASRQDPTTALRE